MNCPPGLPISEQDWEQILPSVQAVVFALWSQNQALKHQVKELHEQVDSLQAAVAKLSELVNRNSKNSSKPPSSDPPYQRKYPK